MRTGLVVNQEHFSLKEKTLFVIMISICGRSECYSFVRPRLPSWTDAFTNFPEDYTEATTYLDLEAIQDHYLP
jgi:hypothetical protein